MAQRIPYGLPGTDGSFKINLREFIKTEHSLLSLYYCHDLHVFTSSERLWYFVITQYLVMVISSTGGIFGGGVGIFLFGTIGMVLLKRFLRFVMEGECLFMSYQSGVENDVNVVYDEQGWMYENLQCFGGKYAPGYSGYLTSCDCCCLCLCSGVRCSHWDRGRRIIQSILNGIYSYAGYPIIGLTMPVLLRAGYTWTYTYPISLLFSLFFLEMFMLWFHYYRNFDRAHVG